MKYLIVWQSSGKKQHFLTDIRPDYQRHVKFVERLGKKVEAYELTEKQQKWKLDECVQALAFGMLEPFKVTTVEKPPLCWEQLGLIAEDLHTPETIEAAYLRKMDMQEAKGVDPSIRFGLNRARQAALRIICIRRNDPNG